jgi:hypothetical protein
MFDGPQRAIRCAVSIRDAVQALGIEVRAGLHTGECEVRGDDIGGIAVHIGARVRALAGPNDVLVSSTLRDLVIGSGLEVEERGAHETQGRARRMASARRRFLGTDRFRTVGLVAFVGVRLVMAAFLGDGLGAVLCAVRLRRGIFRQRTASSSSSTLSSTTTGADGRHNVGNSSRLPGWVVYVCPPREIQSTVPSDNFLGYPLGPDRGAASRDVLMPRKPRRATMVCGCRRCVATLFSVHVSVPSAIVPRFRLLARRRTDS